MSCRVRPSALLNRAAKPPTHVDTVGKRERRIVRLSATSGATLPTSEEPQSYPHSRVFRSADVEHLAYPLKRIINLKIHAKHASYY
eukprot:6315627-Pyramimonas_sp.AAC.1